MAATLPAKILSLAMSPDWRCGCAVSRSLQVKLPDSERWVALVFQAR